MAIFRNFSCNIVLILLILFVHLHIHSAKHPKQDSNATRCTESEVKALMEFKGSLIDHSNLLSSWRGRECCSWYGITCHNLTGFVQSIDLSNAFPSSLYPSTFSLGGEINSSLLNLEHMESLDLSYNNFHGLPIPAFLGSLKNLQYLDLSSAGFRGEIPQQLGNLSNLQELFIGDYPYNHPDSAYSLSSKSLNWIIGLSSLESLGFNTVNLSESVDWLDSFNMLSSLSSLSLSYCGLTMSSNSYSYHVNNLTSLISLDLVRNYPLNSKFPPWLFDLNHLKDLTFFYNGLQGSIPQQLGNMSNLYSLSLVGDYNYETSSSLSSKSLNWITGLSALNYLEFSNINLSESLDWLDSVNMLSSLSYLEVYECGLAGMSMSRSNSHVNLTSLTSLHLHSNHLNVVTFPPWLFNLSHLEDLSFSENGLRGSFPNMFAEMTSLTELQISGNSFTSSFPDSVCNLTALNWLDLSYSDLHGSLPVCLGNLTSLTSLDLSFNKLSGEIPGELGYLNKLTYLDLSFNLFNSSIPSTLGKLTKLQTLDVSDNSLTGELSESFFKGLKSLKYLDISTNQFLVLNVSSQWIPPFQLQYIEMDSVTQFPSWLQTQKNLEKLIMRACISGDISNWCQTAYPLLNYFDVINASKYLDYLSLFDNNISGNIPEELCDLKFLAYLSLANNQLTGRIPLCIGNLLHLEELNLANNSLYGHIPKELGYLDKLLILHLNMNKFFGEIPSSLQNLTLLRTLDLGDNELNGFIPAWIGKRFSAMQYLRLQSNNFSGQITVTLCQLSSLQILNLAQNNLVGTIPPCLGNLSKMLSEEIGQLIHSQTYSYTDRLLNVVKGREFEYSKNLKYAKFISLSSNHLHGEIPNELINLKGLQSLNLSNNDLSGMIPRKIGNLKDLESLDLSMNRICGTIPQSLATIDTLSYLNLSFNNLTGRIPSGNHFDTLYDRFVYEGNNRVCGKQGSCPDDLVTSNKHNGPIYGGDNNEFELSWFYAGIGTGFAIGFLVVLCPLYFNKSWRSAYFDFLENVYNRVWVAFAIKISQIQRKFN